MATPRYAEKFTSDDGFSIVFTFPLNLYEWDSGDQALSSPFSPLTGAHYDYDMLGTALAPKRNAIESVRFVVKGTAAEIEAKITEARQKCYRAGRGKLWALDSTGDRWFAYARLRSVPGFQLENPFVVPVTMDFARMSDWHNDTAITGDVTLDANPKTFSIDNLGNARVFDAVFTFKGTFIDPALTNSTSGYVMASTRDGSNANHWLRFDCGKRRLEFSTNGGTSYAGDYANFVRQPSQVQFMVLEPGVNNFSCAFGGVPSGTLSYSLYPAYHG